MEAAEIYSVLDVQLNCSTPHLVEFYLTSIRAEDLVDVTVSVVKYNTIMSTSYYVAAPYILQLIVSNDIVFK